MGYRCRFCDICDGKGCIGELPGMGGAYENRNFILNCADWDRFAAIALEGEPAAPSQGELPELRLAPITGSVENIGYDEEGPFYGAMVAAAMAAGIRLSIGDGYPDTKLRFGIDALRNAGERAAVFIKPYENHGILERMEWCTDVAEIVGIDIDSHSILTMRNLAKLERKTAAQLSELKKAAGKPFALKGVFLEEDLSLVEQLKPDIVVISNHGGRIETRIGSTAEALFLWGKRLRRFAGELWVDGGIRKSRDLLAAGKMGARTVMIGRPLITALIRYGREGVVRRVAELRERRDGV